MCWLSRPFCFPGRRERRTVTRPSFVICGVLAIHLRRHSALTSTLEKQSDGHDNQAAGATRRVEGTSCLFLMTSDAVEDRVVEAMKQYSFEIIDTNLSEEQEKNLRHAFGEEA